jgi:hypothetical protein
MECCSPKANWECWKDLRKGFSFGFQFSVCLFAFEVNRNDRFESTVTDLN